MTETATSSIDAAEGESPAAIRRDVQGGVIGFNKDHVLLQYVTFADTASAKAFVSQLIPHLATGEDVLDFNALYGQIADRGGAPETEIEARWMNVLLTVPGLTKVGAPGMDAMPEEFRATMAGRADQIGDVGRNAPATWVAPFTGGTEPDAVIQISADTTAGLALRQQQVEQIAAANSVTIVGSQAGDTRPVPNAGREHFGFRDGISQPSIEGLTKASKTTSKPAIMKLGDVLIGYTDSEGNISGDVPQTPSGPIPTQYDPNPPAPPSVKMPDWTHNASFVVLRRLRQDVAGFQASMTNTATTVGLTPGQLGAKVVGRWASGAPMEHVPGMPADIDPAAVDANDSWPVATSSKKINNFDYDSDPDGLAVPRAAHVRKMNPRSENLPGGDRTSSHRMLRRGIPYGPEFTQGEAPYGTTVPDTQDRGLLFISYQASIARAFEFVQRRWSNVADFPQAGDGKDPMIAQDTDTRAFTAPPHPQMNFEQWVFTTGGAYLISPSISGLRALSS